MFLGVDDCSSVFYIIFDKKFRQKYLAVKSAINLVVSFFSKSQILFKLVFLNFSLSVN